MQVIKPDGDAAVKTFIPSLLLFLGVTLSISNTGRTQTSAPAPAAENSSVPSIDQIIERAALASGGKAAWSRITSMYLKGSIEIPASHATGTFESYNLAPNKAYQSITLGDVVVAKQGFDGANAWKLTSDHGVVDIQGEDLEDTKLDSDFYSEINLKQLYPRMVLQEDATIAGHSAYAILATPLHGKPRKLYFDKETGLRVGMSSEITEGGKTSQVEMYFEDFKPVEGIQVPYTTRLVSQDLNMVFHLQNIRINLPILNWTFLKPASNTNAAASIPTNSSRIASPTTAGGVYGNTYSNGMFGFSYTYPAGWTPQGDATNQEIMKLGRGLAGGDDPARKAAFDVALERTYQLLTVFQYPVGTPGKPNSSIQVIAERVDFAPGIKDGKDYLLNLESQIKRGGVHPEFSDNITEFTIGGKQFFRLDNDLRFPIGLIHQMYISTKLDKFILSFILTSRSQEDLNMLYNTLGSLKFDSGSR